MLLNKINTIYRVEQRKMRDKLFFWIQTMHIIPLYVAPAWKLSRIQPQRQDWGPVKSMRRTSPPQYEILRTWAHVMRYQNNDRWTQNFHSIFSFNRFLSFSWFKYFHFVVRLISFRFASVLRFGEWFCDPFFPLDRQNTCMQIWTKGLSEAIWSKNKRSRWISYPSFIRLFQYK